MAIAPSCVVPRSSQAPWSRLLIFVPARASSSPDLSRKAKPLSTASTTSTGATSVSSRNSRPSERTSSAFPAPDPRAARARLSANCSSLPGNLCDSLQQAARRVIDIQRRGQDTVTDSPKHGRASMTRQAAKAKQYTLSTARNAKPKAASCRIPGVRPALLECVSARQISSNSVTIPQLLSWRADGGLTAGAHLQQWRTDYAEPRTLGEN